ncbi:integrase arm-type DNA-binding domain-containing protein [Acidisoma sp.]|uniref:integrase arm-type DNA-binding domain-containing protein n=1 Tax=Acidisoma sp. TaxID=1872115 RepID=UPI0038CF4F6A
MTVQGKAKRWTFRYKSPANRKRRVMGLGSCQDVTLAGARQGAGRQLLDISIDSITPSSTRSCRRSEARGQNDVRSSGRVLYKDRKARLDRPARRPCLAQSPRSQSCGSNDSPRAGRGPAHSSSQARRRAARCRTSAAERLALQIV